MAWLVMTAGPWSGREFRLDDVTTLGRAGESDIVLDDSGISRQHAKIRLRDGQFVLHDLATTNGTFVKNRETGEWEEISQHMLREGDQIQIGRYELAFIQVEPDKAES
jgi:pSer/pThr/pTyr-binding forkhead associated (FHA) protein